MTEGPAEGWRVTDFGPGAAVPALVWELNKTGSEAWGRGLEKGHEAPLVPGALLEAGVGPGCQDLGADGENLL